MKKLFASIIILFATLSVNAQTSTYSAPPGKAIYIPHDLEENDFTNPESKWSYARMAYTNDVVIFWEKDFGDDLSKAPDLEGKNMKVDLNNLIEKVQSFYDYFRDTLEFIRPGSNADKYRMMVMLNYSLEGTAYGGDYDGKIGALWIAPNRVQDKKLNCIAHELGHSFQSQISCDGQGEAWGGSGFFEMTSQWMLWQVNPYWLTDENYHWEAFKNLTHLAFLHLENIYHSPYVIEYWAEKHGKTTIADLFRQGKRGEDPAQTYMRMYGINTQQMNDEMFECYRKLITFDFDRVRTIDRQYANEISTPTEMATTMGKGWLKPAKDRIPQRLGFNVIPLEIPKPGKSVKVTFKGLSENDNCGWRYGFVGVTDKDKPIYGECGSSKNGKITFKTDKNVNYKHIWLVVMGAPQDYNAEKYDFEHQDYVEYPYAVKIK